MSIAPVGPNVSIPALGGGVAAPQPGGAAAKPFAQLVSDLLSDSNVQQLQADQAVEQLVSGKTDNVHGVVLSVAKADLAFRLVLEIRNHLIDSYQEIMRMQI